MSPPRTIVHLITSLGGGGSENFLFQILSGTPPGFSHEVYFLGHDGVNGERIRRLGIPVRHVESLYAFYRRLRMRRPAMLHTCLYWAHQLGRVIGRLANVPLIVSSHQSIDVWQQPWHGWIDRWTLPLCSVVDVNSAAAQGVLESRLRNSDKKPRFVRVDNGVDFNRFKPLDKRQTRLSCSLPSDAIVGGTLMRLHPEKGAEKIPAFAGELLRQYPNLVLLIGGVGPLGPRLMEETRGWGERIQWLGWQDDTVRFLSSLDFFWLLSREESFPQALLEASAMALPWLAPDVGGIHELQEAGACGLLTSSDRIVDIRAAAQTLLAELPARKARAQEAVPRLRARYSLQAMTQAFYRIADENNL